MTELSRAHRSRVLPNSTVTSEELQRRKIQRHELSSDWGQQSTIQNGIS